jgi:ABC-type uncharacterized transport system fused permease/ATPase subunit
MWSKAAFLVISRQALVKLSYNFLQKIIVEYIAVPIFAHQRMEKRQLAQNRDLVVEYDKDIT